MIGTVGALHPYLVIPDLDGVYMPLILYVEDRVLRGTQVGSVYLFAVGQHADGAFIRRIYNCYRADNPGCEYRCDDDNKNFVLHLFSDILNTLLLDLLRQYRMIKVCGSHGAALRF